MLWAGWSRDQIPVRARFFTSVQTGPGARPRLYTVGTVPFPGVKWTGCSIDHRPLSSTKIKEGVQLCFYSSSVPSWQVIG